MSATWAEGAKRAVTSALRSHTPSSSPARPTASATPRPMSPSPITPTVVAGCIGLADVTGCIGWADVEGCTGLADVADCAHFQFPRISPSQTGVWNVV